MPKKKKKTKSKTKQKKVLPKVHLWRPCPYGRHWVVTQRYRVPPSKIHPDGSWAVQSGHCRANPSGKDCLYPDDINAVATNHFGSLTGPPAANPLDWPKKGNRYNSLIRGWTQYWNDVLKPKLPLDPDLIKALIASESSFNRLAWNQLRGQKSASGLMQVLNSTVPLLNDPKELRDHFVNIDREDLEDPNMNICSGIRWLFRKKQIEETKAEDSVSWRDAVAAYKGVKPSDPLLDKFDGYFKRLKGAKK